MIGAGTFINPLLKIVTTVAILGAVYLFLVKPVLDTTSDTIDRAFKSAQPALNQAQHLANQQGVSNFDTPSNVGVKRAQRILACVQRANGDVAKIQACTQ